MNRDLFDMMNEFRYFNEMQFLEIKDKIDYIIKNNIDDYETIDKVV